MAKKQIEDELDDDVLTALKDIVGFYRDEDRVVRYRQVRNYKRLKYYWDGITTLYTGGVAHDWRVWDSQFLANAQNPADELYYDKNINVFKAYLESIIAALSISTPSVKAFPDDADNIEDLTTSKCADKICELFAKHQDVSLLWLHALFVYVTEGLVWSYNYTKCSEEYGTYEEPDIQEEEQEVDKHTCATCGTDLIDDGMSEQLVNEFDPENGEAQVLLSQGKMLCPQCIELVDPQVTKDKIIVERIVGVNSKPKSRECIEIYGGLNVKTPTYARTVAQMPYLILSDEISTVEAVSLDPERFYNKWSSNGTLQPGSPEIMGNWMRTSTQYMGAMPENVVTRERIWLQPIAYYNCKDEDTCKKLQKQFPNGIKITAINDDIFEVEGEALKDHWTPSIQPLADYLQFDPLGNTLTSIQDITRDLVSLTLQTIEYGIPQVFADPSFIDFEAYGQNETRPGMIYPTKPLGSKAIGEGITQLKASTLSGEVLPFSDKIQEAGQMVSGALPSLFGGNQPNSSKTAAQYSMSRAQALQRLQNTWKTLSVWWKNVNGKIIPAYIKCVLESGDEKFVIKNEAGNFINVLIRRSELQGKIGSIELESSEELPVMYAQKKEVVMQLLQSPNPMILDALTQPQNLPVLRDALGLNDFMLPGEDDREKQLEEIKILLASEPVMGPMGEKPSVEIEPQVDNNALEAEVCKEFLKSDAGRLAKVENEAGYRNVLLHMMQHVDIQKAMQALEMGPPQQPQQNAGESKPAIAKGTPDEHANSEPGYTVQ